MATPPEACLDALREAARRLGESPTKADYEALGLTPASATIIRRLGGWNDAKRQAGLETNPSTGSRAGSKPDQVDCTDEEWAEMSVDQRWHYRNVEHNTERTLRRRAKLRAWVDVRKAERRCADCGTDDPACLDCHHESEKTATVARMAADGRPRAEIRDEMARCTVLCANCHRLEHAERSVADDNHK